MKTSLFALALLTVCLSVFAQEVLIPLDSAGTVETITADLEQKLKLFGDYSTFREARLFQLADSTYVLEVYYKPQAQLLKDRKPLTSMEADALRQKVTAQIHTALPRLGLRQEGRARFVTGTTILALGYYGWAIPRALEVPSTATSVATYLLIGGAGYYVPYLITRNASITSTQASMVWYGGSRGIVHGFLLNMLIRGEDMKTSDVLASGVVVSLGEVVALYQAGKRWDVTPGKVSVMAVGGDYGLLFGLGASALGEMSEREGAVTLLLSHGAGLLAGKLMYDSHPYSKGDARVLSALAWLGAGVGVAISDVAGNTQFDPFTVAALSGSLSGLAAGHMLTRDTRFTDGQGALIALGELGGALSGAGLAYVIRRGKGDERPYVGLAALGGVAGFYLSYRALTPSAPKKTALWDMQLSPAALSNSPGSAKARLVPGIGAHITF